MSEGIRGGPKKEGLPPISEPKGEVFDHPSVGGRVRGEKPATPGTVDKIVGQLREMLGLGPAKEASKPSVTNLDRGGFPEERQRGIPHQELDTEDNK